MTRTEKIIEAKHEAERFIQKAEAALRALHNEPMAEITGCKETGAARRASLDLTRALAEMRKP